MSSRRRIFETSTLFTTITKLIQINVDAVEQTFLIMGLFVGTIVTLSLYILSNSVLSVAAVPVIPQSFGNCRYNKHYELKVLLLKLLHLVSLKIECPYLEKEVLVTNRRQGHSFILDGQTFFCFNCLVKSIAPSPPLTEIAKYQIHYDFS